MKTYRTLTIALAVLAVLFAFLWLTGGKKTAKEEPREMWQTNTVHLLVTNTVDRWRTNTLELTNTIVKAVTNEVIKEVPARLSAAEVAAGAAGVRYLNAPSLAEGGGALYKANPVALEVNIDPGATNLLAAGTAGVRKAAEGALSTRGIPVAGDSPHRLVLGISETWSTDVPGVAVLSFKLLLWETVALQRQNDLIKCPAVVWTTTLFKLIQTENTSNEVEKAAEETMIRFCDDYAKGKESQKGVESRLPAVPPVFSQ